MNSGKQLPIFSAHAKNSFSINSGNDNTKNGEIPKRILNRHKLFHLFRTVSFPRFALLCVQNWLFHLALSIDATAFCVAIRSFSQTDVFFFNIIKIFGLKLEKRLKPFVCDACIRSHHFIIFTFLRKGRKKWWKWPTLSLAHTRTFLLV